MARWLIGCATILGFGLRIWPPGQLGLNQFDEGIYLAAAGWVFQPGGIAALPATLIPYAPPGYPILVGLLGSLIGLTDETSLFVSATCGTLTIPVVAHIATKIFDRRIGVLCAWCVCCSGTHIAFSRMGLTDATFLLAWSLTFWLCWRFLVSPSWWSGISMGFGVGIVQEFKYNGWLLGALTILAVLAGLVFVVAERQWQRWVRFLSFGGLAVLLAWIVVWPWFDFVEKHGGYANLLQHQRSYLGGWHRWPANFVAQVTQAVQLAGPTWLGCLNTVALTVSWRLLAGNDGTRRLTSWWELTLIACSLWPLYAAPVTSGIVFFILFWSHSTPGIRFLKVSWLVLFLLSPFYHPYARLWLPLEHLHWIILGSITGRVAELGSMVDNTKICARQQRVGYGGVGILLGGFLIFGPGFPFAGSSSFSHAGLFDPSNALRITASQIAQDVPSDVRGLRTFVRPAIANYLIRSHQVFPCSSLDQLNTVSNRQLWALVDSTLLTGDLTDASNSHLSRWIEPISGHWEVVREYFSVTTLPTALDLEPNRRDYQRDRSMACFWLLRPRESTP